MKGSVVLSLVILLNSYSTLVTGNDMEDKNMSNEIIKFSGWAIPYVVVAYNDFVLKNSSINNYQISVEDNRNLVIVKFTPDFSLSEGMVLGGKTKNGRFVKYTFEKESEHNFTRTYAR